MKKCKYCGKPTDTDFCNKDCLEQYKQKQEKFQKACPESTKILDEAKNSKNVFTDDLRDGAFQRGILWRKTKLEAINKARQSGLSDDEVIRELRLGGITVQKARELMKDSEELLGR